MDDGQILAAWRTQGFVILPGFLTAAELAPAQAGLEQMFPRAERYHNHSDPRSSRFAGDEFAGIDQFPFGSTELSLLAVHDRLAGLTRMLLGTDGVRLYSAEAWAKYTGAADYGQVLHRDYLNHTVLVPPAVPDQAELFVFLCDVPEALGPPHLVSRAHTDGLRVRPNWYPRSDGAAPGDSFVCPAGRPDLYEVEESGAGPAGTVIAFSPGTLHRGTNLTMPGGARYSMQLCYRDAAAEWGERQAWASLSHQPAWYEFVAQATPGQLALVGFPPPGHAFWTPQTAAAMGLRYPGTDWAAWLRT